MKNDEKINARTNDAAMKKQFKIIICSSSSISIEIISRIC